MLSVSCSTRFRSGVCRESREITLRIGITELAFLDHRGAESETAAKGGEADEVAGGRFGDELG